MEEEQVDPEWERLVQGLRNTVRACPLRAPEQFTEIAWYARENKVAMPKIEAAARVIGDYIRGGSVFKKRMMAEKISKLNLLVKILLIRDFGDMFSTAFSIQAAVSAVSTSKSRVEMIRKPKLDQPMAIGINRNGRLGIGSAVEEVTELTPILLPPGLLIREVSMAEHHTIFVMENDDIYGAGKAKYFMSTESEEDILVPVLLDYATGHNLPIAETTGTILERDGIGFLLVGPIRLMREDVEHNIRETGPNWRLVDFATCLPTSHFTVDLRPWDDGPMRTYQIHIDHLEWKSMQTENKGFIVFFLSGRRVSCNDCKETSICNDGTVYTVYSDIIYQGELRCGPRQGDPEHEVIIAVMEEMAFPFEATGHHVCKQNDASVFYGNPSKYLKKMWSEEFERTKIKPPWFSNYRLIPKTPTLDIIVTHHYFFDELKEKFEEVTRGWNWAEKVYAKETSWPPLTGLPSNGLGILHHLLAIQHLLRFNEETGLPMIWTNVAEEPAQLCRRFSKALNTPFAIEPLVVPAGYEQHEKELREEQVLKAGAEFLNPIVADIARSIERLKDIPLKYRIRNQDVVYNGAVYAALLTLDHCLTTDTSKHKFECLEHRAHFLDRPDMKKLVEQRLAAGDIQPGDARFNTIRVEVFLGGNSRFPETAPLCIVPRVVHVIGLFLDLVDPSLWEFVTDNVLNMNRVAAVRADTERILEVFFPMKIDMVSLAEFVNPYVIQKMCERLPPSEKYIIETNDEQTVEVPSVLFQMFSNGFDAARKRAAEAAGEDPLRFSLDASAAAVTHLVEIMLDAKSFFNFDMKMKEEVFLIADHCMVKVLEPELLRMILLTAKETDHKFIAALFKYNEDLMVDMVAQFRSDMILNWKTIPFEGNQIGIMEKIAKRIYMVHYTRIKLRDDKMGVPAFALEDRIVDTEKICIDWLTRQFIDTEKDQDIINELAITKVMWEEEVNVVRGRKRPLDDVDVIDLTESP